MAQLSISSDFFKKERDSAYANWREAFWRENMQNALDAGATAVTIRTKALCDAVVQVEFFDNGCGMDRRTLDEVYFNLGQSTKTSGDTVGGFGRARMLTCFGMHRYAIATQDQRVEGAGSHYDIQPGPFVQGCQLTIEVDDTTENELVEALHTYLRLCQPQSCKVLVQDQVWTAWSPRGRFARELELASASETSGPIVAKVYVTKKTDTPQVIVRVGGAAMFTFSTRAKAQVVVELDTATARQVLTSNRDGMLWRYRSALDRYVEELAVDTTSALRPRFSPKNSTFDGAGWVMASAFVREDPANTPPATPLAGVVCLKRYVAARTTPPESSAQSLEDASAHPGEDASDEAQPEDPVGRCFAKDLPRVVVHVESENPRLHKVIARYDPKNWVWTRNKDGKLVRQGGELYKLLLTWLTCTEEATRALLAAYPNMDPFYFAVGWTFSDTAEAACMGTDPYRMFLLKPVNADGQLQFKLSERASLKRMMAYAKHEAAHVRERWHDEDYAHVLTNLDVHFDERRVFSRIAQKVRGS